MDLPRMQQVWPGAITEKRCVWFGEGLSPDFVVDGEEVDGASVWRSLGSPFFGIREGKGISSQLHKLMHSTEMCLAH